MVTQDHEQVSPEAPSRNENIGLLKKLNNPKQKQEREVIEEEEAAAAMDNEQIKRRR